MIRRFVVVGTSNDVPDNQIRMCGFFASEFKTGDVVYVTKEPITRAPIELTVNNDIHIDEEALKKYACIISPHASFELCLDDGFDVISIILKTELKGLNYYKEEEK
jgi:hypothetical protein